MPPFTTRHATSRAQESICCPAKATPSADKPRTELRGCSHMLGKARNAYSTSQGKQTMAVDSMSTPRCPVLVGSAAAVDRLDRIQNIKCSCDVPLCLPLASSSYHFTLNNKLRCCALMLLLFPFVLVHEQGLVQSAGNIDG
ncbi:hypothetical protein B296_00009531 [Ensete ventricosum]|uniref:Uncharacterized protein n=1 Tax=Ensete ventricosum TaxID=4639 RepID=A0A426ZJC2_ENSVE|nr:hypothetical protein B296_00009531 [Ensete ventricosum]